MRSKRLTDSARGQTCVRCGANRETVCARHYNGLRQHRLGKGMGTKCSDLASAELCASCDAMFSEGVMPWHFQGVSEYVSKALRSEEFLFLCMLTNIRRQERGDL